MKLKEKINHRMNELQEMMETNQHLVDPALVQDKINSIEKFWPALEDEDRDYIHVAKNALDNKSEWRI